jgi:hypothetical protein
VPVCAARQEGSYMRLRISAGLWALLWAVERGMVLPDAD